MIAQKLPSQVPVIYCGRAGMRHCGAQRYFPGRPTKATIYKSFGGSNNHLQNRNQYDPPASGHGFTAKHWHNYLLCVITPQIFQSRGSIIVLYTRIAKSYCKLGWQRRGGRSRKDSHKWVIVVNLATWHNRVWINALFLYMPHSVRLRTGGFLSTQVTNKGFCATLWCKFTSMIN